jgi:hypothetical protein
MTASPDSVIVPFVPRLLGRRRRLVVGTGSED